MTKTYYTFDAEYASETSLVNIPAGYINKTVCGCGLTSLAIEKETNNVVIAVPTVTLVNNKVEQYPNDRMPYKLLGVTGETDNNDIERYISQCYTDKVPYKIMVTYDSICKVEHLLDEAHLIIDESDCLLKFAKMKAASKGGRKMDVINYLLDVAERYKETVSFISATPVPISYFERKWMEEMPFVEMNWTSTIKVNPYLLQRKSVKNAIIEEIINPIVKYNQVRIGNNTFKKVIIFFNTVKGIKDILKKAKVNPFDCGIICANSVRNDFVLGDGTKLERIEDFSNLPKFTFVTSTGYNGCDIYDKEAMNVVVSDITNDWQITDINTDLKQAISRQRIKGNPNYDRYVFIYNNIPSFDELEGKIEALKQKITNNINGLNILKGINLDSYNSLFETVCKDIDFNRYTFINEEGNYELNNLALNSDKYFLNETIAKYKNGEIMMNTSNVIEKPKYTTNYSYKVMYDKYVNYVSGAYEFTEDEKDTEAYELLDAYYKQYGKLEKDSSYAKKRLEAEGSFKAVGLAVLKYFNKGNRYTNKEVKTKLQTAYDEIGLNRKAKATDVFELFGSKVKAVKNNGERFIEFI